MDFAHVYWMHNAHMCGVLHLRAREDIGDPQALLRGESLPPKPLVFDYFSGGKPRDLIGTTHATHLLSDKVINILRGEGFTGWTTYPVEIYGKGKERIDGYHGFAVTGRCGPIDDSRSVERWRDPRVPSAPGQKIKVWVGFYFDPATWDGSDVFMPGRSTFAIVVEPVKRALEKAKVKNIGFECLTEFERLML